MQRPHVLRGGADPSLALPTARPLPQLGPRGGGKQEWTEPWAPHPRPAPSLGRSLLQGQPACLLPLFLRREPPSCPRSSPAHPRGQRSEKLKVPQRETPHGSPCSIEGRGIPPRMRLPHPRPPPVSGAQNQPARFRVSARAAGAEDALPAKCSESQEGQKKQAPVSGAGSRAPRMGEGWRSVLWGRRSPEGMMV